MKKILFFSFSLLLTGLSPSFGQDNSPIDLREKSMHFFVNSMHQFDSKNDNIIPAFRKSKDKHILYWYNNVELDLVTQLYDTRKANPVWRNAENGLYYINKKFDDRNGVSFLTDSTQQGIKSAENITVSIFNILYDSEYAYVVLRFKSVGRLEIFYTGELMCKFDKQGNLVKYSYIER